MNVNILAVANMIKNGETLYTFTNGLLPFFGDFEENINFISARRDKWKALLPTNLDVELFRLDRNW